MRRAATAVNGSDRHRGPCCGRRDCRRSRSRSLPPNWARRAPCSARSRRGCPRPRRPAAGAAAPVQPLQRPGTRGPRRRRRDDRPRARSHRDGRARTTRIVTRPSGGCSCCAAASRPTPGSMSPRGRPGSGLRLRGGGGAAVRGLRRHPPNRRHPSRLRASRFGSLRPEKAPARGAACHTRWAAARRRLRPMHGFRGPDRLRSSRRDPHLPRRVGDRDHRGGRAGAGVAAAIRRLPDQSAGRRDPRRRHGVRQWRRPDRLRRGRVGARGSPRGRGHGHRQVPGRHRPIRRPAAGWRSPQAAPRGRPHVGPGRGHPAGPGVVVDRGDLPRPRRRRRGVRSTTIHRRQQAAHRRARDAAAAARTAHPRHRRDDGGHPGCGGLPAVPDRGPASLGRAPAFPDHGHGSPAKPGPPAAVGRAGEPAALRKGRSRRAPRRVDPSRRLSAARRASAAAVAWAAAPPAAAVGRERGGKARWRASRRVTRRARPKDREDRDPT